MSTRILSVSVATATRLRSCEEETTLRTVSIGTPVNGRVDLELEEDVALALAAQNPDNPEAALLDLIRRAEQRN